jgi:lactate dehydrogenase-like 2-hydroxyacid dehydrogenase
MSNEETVVITKKRLRELEDSELKLTALEQAGVDNWDWYDDAMEEYNRMLREIIEE